MAVSRCAHCRALTGSFATFVRQPLAQEKKPITRMKREPREMGVVAGVVAFLLAAALAIAMLMIRLGLAWGDWMRRIRR